MRSPSMVPLIDSFRFEPIIPEETYARHSHA
jgi:hypothetical protein